MTLGETIRLLRGSETLREAAGKLGITHVHLHNVESGKVGCSFKVIQSVGEVYGYDPYALWFLANSGEVTKHLERAANIARGREKSLPMIASKDLRCTECGNPDTDLSLQVYLRKSIRLVRFRVDCGRCGCFSHYLKSGPVQVAVKTYLDRQFAGEQLVETVIESA